MSDAGFLDLPDIGNWWGSTTTPQVNAGGVPNYDASSSGSPSSDGWGQFLQVVNKGLDVWGHVDEANAGIHYPYTAESTGMQTPATSADTPPPTTTPPPPTGSPTPFDWSKLTDFNTPWPYVTAIGVVGVIYLISKASR